MKNNWVDAMNRVFKWAQTLTPEQVDALPRLVTWFCDTVYTNDAMAEAGKLRDIFPRRDDT